MIYAIYTSVSHNGVGFTRLCGVYNTIWACMACTCERHCCLLIVQQHFKWHLKNKMPANIFGILWKGFNNFPAFRQSIENSERDTQGRKSTLHSCWLLVVASVFLLQWLKAVYVSKCVCVVTGSCLWQQVCLCSDWKLSVAASVFV